MSVNYVVYHIKISYFGKLIKLCQTIRFGVPSDDDRYYLC
jgi:hypothetical protein